MNNIKQFAAVSRVNFKHTAKPAYLVAIILLLAGLSDLIVDSLTGNREDMTISIYSFLCILCVMLPILFASNGYRKLMNLGVRKKTYLGGCFINYLMLSALISLLGVIEHFLIDNPLNAGGMNIYGLIRVFDWGGNVFQAFFCLFAFLMLAQTIFHTLTFIQTKWYGWVADLIVVVILSVFTPIDALRQVETAFFNLIIFAKPAIAQVAACLGLSVAVYATNLIYLKQRA